MLLWACVSRPEEAVSRIKVGVVSLLLACNDGNGWARNGRLSKRQDVLIRDKLSPAKKIPMMNQRIAQVVVGLPVEGPFDYFIPENFRERIAPGHRVDVPFGRRRLVGYVTHLKAASQYRKLKSVISILDNAPVLDKSALEFCQKFARYYGCTLGAAIEAGLPRALRLKKPQDAGEAVLAADVPGSFQAVLCHDKGQKERWPFIIDAIKKVLAENKNVIFLVPEKYFLNQVWDILRPAWDAQIAVVDKKISPGQELQQWRAFRKGDYRVVLGTRSAVFAPLARLGLIVVYEESHPAYKQEQSPFYHAREAAFMRAETFGCGLLFVDAVPSEEIWQAAKLGKIQKVTFESRAQGQVKVVDLIDYKRRKQILLSFPLQNSITDVLNRKGKVLLFCNRRGFSTMIRCNECGHSMRCPRCDVHLIYLYSKKKLFCTLCRHAEDLPPVCPGCQKAYLRYLGSGVEKIESEISRIFPQARISRFDKETSALNQDADIVIATQAIFKVVDQNLWNTVGILDVDSQLNRVDFRSGHSVFSLLVRLRQAAREKLFIQTFHPEHYAIKAAQRDEFEKFYRQELKFRRDCQLPPFRRMAAVCLRGAEKEDVFEQTTGLYERLNQAKTGQMEISEPQPDFLPKLRDKYRFIIMVKDRSLKKTLPLIKRTLGEMKKKSGIVTTINVDP